MDTGLTRIKLIMQNGNFCVSLISAKCGNSLRSTVNIIPLFPGISENQALIVIYGV